ncbi:hypothetical protein EAE96_005349 [Botrytis aclada]|nr:hypothetical protein EAE96_005349 [Botrytis aclada]
MLPSLNRYDRPAPTQERVSQREDPDDHSPRTLRYPGVSELEVQATIERNRTAPHTTALNLPSLNSIPSTLAPSNSIPDAMSIHSSRPSHEPSLRPVVISRNLLPRSDRYRSPPPAGQDTGVTYTPTSGANRSSPRAGQDTVVTHTPTSAAPDQYFPSTAWDNPAVTHATNNGLQYPSYRPQPAPDNSMLQHAPAVGRPNNPSRPVDSENPTPYGANIESQYPHNATQGISENRTSHDTERAYQGVPDDRAPHHTYPQGQYPAAEQSSSYSVAQRWDSNTRPSAYQEPYRPYPDDRPHYSGQYQEPVQDGRPVPAGYNAPFNPPSHHSFHDGRLYSQQPPPPTHRHHSYQDSRGYPQQQPPPAIRHHSYNDERGYSQQQHPPPPSHHSYQDNTGYQQQQPPHPSHYPYHDGRGYPQDQPPAAQQPLRQSAPRQRTAIACKYCRRRKIRCSGFTADGSGGQCTNCARFKQECVFTPVSSAQAFVPLIALTEALAHSIDPRHQAHQAVYGAHGQRLPGDSRNQNPTESYEGYHPQQAAPGPQMAYNHQQMSQQVANHPPQQVAQYAPQHVQQPIQQTHLPPMNRSPHDRDILPSPTGSMPQQTPSNHLPSLSNRSPYDQSATVPSPTGSLDSQKRKREADERHFARAAPPAPGQFSGYNRESNAPYRTPTLQDQYQYRPSVPSPPTRQYEYQQGENVAPRPPALQDEQQYRSLVPSPPSNQQHGYQQGENALAYRPMEDDRQSNQWAPVNLNEPPRNGSSPNGSSTSFHSQNPSSNHQPSQVSPYRAESAQVPLASPAITNSGSVNHDQGARENERPNQMNIANIVEHDTNRVDRDMLRRLGGKS